MPRRAVSNWVTAEVAILGMVLLAALMKPEEDLLLPERRDWRGALRRMVSPAARRMREIQGEREARAYVRALHGEPETITVRSDLDSRRFETVLLTRPAEGHEKDRPPWATAPFAVSPGGPPMDRPRRAERRPSTLVREAVRPAIRGDLGNYLARMPGYPEE
jgi:hypothetical protein